MKRAVKWVVPMLILFLTIVPAPAQTRDEPAVILDEIVVTATKTTEVRKDVPNAVIIVDDLDIAEFPGNSLGTVLANDPGIDLRTYGDYGGAGEEIHIRGMSGNASQVYVNGISVNSPSLGLADVSRIPLNSVERIEVVKGSGSLLYGSGAMGGTVNITTKGPRRDRMDLKAEAGYGTENTCRLSVEQGMFVTDSFGYYLTVSRHETDGFRDNSDLEHNDVSLKLVYDGGDMLAVSLYGDYVDREYGSPGVKPPEGTQAFSVNGVRVYNDEAASLLDHAGDEDGNLGMQIVSSPLEWMEITLRGSFSSLESYNYSRYYDSWAGDLPGTESRVANDVSDGEALLELTPVGGFSLLTGVEYRDIEWESRTDTLDGQGGKLSEVKENADVYTRGVFSEMQYRPCSWFKLLAGARHEQHSVFGYAVVPRYGLVFNPLEHTVLKASYGGHFNAPTPNDLFWPDDGYTKGNPELKPETGWHTDVTIEQALFDDRLFVTLTYFGWKIDDKIQWGPDSAGVWTPQNLRKYTAKGQEVGVKLGPFSNMTVALNYTHTDAVEENRDYTRQDYGWPPLLPADFRYTWVERRAALTPEHLFKGTLTWWTDFGTTVTVVARFVGDRLWYRTETDGTYPDTKTVEYELDAYWTADCRIQQRLNDHWLLSLQGNNIFNKGYDTYYGIFYDSTGAGTVCGFPGAGRSVYASLTYDF
ncbi:MAG: TonB-dependent receptor [Deltaproteobacteria bacterium]|nr:TonB-dependent receptor [Deltaproteobacteria bacterium]